MDRILNENAARFQIVFQNPTCKGLRFVVSNLADQQVFLRTWDLKGQMIKSDSIYVDQYGVGFRENWFEKDGAYAINLSAKTFFHQQKIIHLCPTN